MWRCSFHTSLVDLLFRIMSIYALLLLPTLRILFILRLKPYPIGTTSMEVVHNFLFQAFLIKLFFCGYLTVTVLSPPFFGFPTIFLVSIGCLTISLFVRLSSSCRAICLARLYFYCSLWCLVWFFLFHTWSLRLIPRVNYLYYSWCLGNRF